MRTISRLFDSRVEASEAAGDLVAAGNACVKITVIGPYRDELANLGIFAPAILGGTFSGLVCLAAFAAFGIDPHVARIVCASIAGALIGWMAAAPVKQNDANSFEGIVLVTAHVDDDAIEVAQEVLNARISATPYIAEAA
ncbi:hypothetical protein [Mesorhizobium sp. ES1-4]|uniref:hypothetical protein n=1 Tax=Mesorhizobium sp. ES1-4 TaxID=2876627 RepID=UPI001CCAEC28|nr:hypothetical protein [Mesorhizobium sp. ES1-4]MBZ9798345.1 hypothetical protein [Mesorhizobium sp. ES1-4]